MNILITSAGRRTYLVQYFRQALSEGGLVYASNSLLSPALFAADGYFLTPPICSDEYVPFLIRRSKELGIDLIISLFDLDLPVLAAHKKEFEDIGATLALSDLDTIRICNDKFLMSCVLKENGIDVPRSVLLADEAISLGLNYPIVVKPRFGMGSIGIVEAGDESELRAAFSMCKKKIAGSYLSLEAPKEGESTVIAQELTQGTEYGIDIVSDPEGNFVTSFIRKKLAMRAGETDEAILLGDDSPAYGPLFKAAENISGVLHPKWIIDVDIIMSDDDKRPVVIDINARFGGGYPFSHIAGADVPRAYILWAMGQYDEALSCLSVRPGTRGYKEIEIRTLSHEQ